MRVDMQVERPEDVRVTLMITMTVGQWDVITGALTGALQGQDAWKPNVATLRNAIESATYKIKSSVRGESSAVVSE